MTSQKNKWRLKNEQKLIKLYDVKSDYQKNSDSSGKPQNGGKVRSRS